ncbi:MAG: hypothetical protein FRX49_11224 [Trebouxia sp. A1-2]|nr:MAG: hypothetical protein FRX49_11224 [Trebouxia sp. A1-2]
MSLAAQPSILSFISGIASSACVWPATVLFEQMSGRQNMESTVPVMPQQADAMLDNTSPFTDVSNSIYSNGLGTGWSTAPANNSVTLAVQEAGAGLQGSAGLCINVTYTKGTAYQVLLSGQDSGIANHPLADSIRLEVWTSRAVFVPGTVNESLLKARRECKLPRHRNQLVKQVDERLSRSTETEAEALTDNDSKVASGPAAV